MIIENCFPTQATWGEFQYTDNIPDIPIQTFPDAYYLGWISPDNVPRFCKPTKIDFDENTSDVAFTVYDNGLNKDVGYAGSRQDTNYWTRMFSSYFSESSDKYVLGLIEQGTGMARLCNGFIWQKQSYRTILLTFRFYNGQNSWEENCELTIVQFREFIKNSGTITTSGGSVFSLSDFGDYGIYHNEETGQYTFIVDFTLNCNKPLNDQGGSGQTDSAPVHAFISDFIDDKHYITTYHTSRVINDSASTIGWTNTVSMPMQYVAFDDVSFKFFPVAESFEMNIDQLRYTAWACQVERNVIARNYRYGISLAAAVHPLEIYKYASLHRWDTQGDTAREGYADGEIWYPKYNLSTFEFECDLITGTPTVVPPLIPEWMKGNINESEYSEEDKPEPEVPDEEEIGDRVPPQIRYFTGTSEFITQYAMTNLQVSQFGHLLWTTWVDALNEPTDMWKNFKLAFGSYLNTGSIDFSEALKCIVSLKMFPFAIPNTQHDVLVNYIQIGSGAYPIEVQNIYKVMSPLIYLDFGTVHIPNTFRDFRDYDGMDITAVLPYCGTAKLNPGDVVGRDIRCRYAIDLQSGACTAIITSWGNPTDVGGIGEMYAVAQLNGQIGHDIPLSATNSGQLAARRLQDATSFAGMYFDSVKYKAGIAQALLSGQDKVETIGNGIIDGGNMVLNNVNKFANFVSQPAIASPMLSGGGGLSSFIQPRTPFIQMRYGIYPTVGNYNHTVGTPSSSSARLSEYIGKGFIVCNNVDVSSLTCHNDEKAAIKTALESGVFI